MFLRPLVCSVDPCHILDVMGVWTRVEGFLGSSKFCAILLPVISDMVQAKMMGNAGT